MNTIDLQIQTTASDGKHAPREVVAAAKEYGISVIAITDHDTVGGVEEALRAGGEFGIRVIPGIEMSVEERGAHILGYGIDYKNPELLNELEKFRKGRINGAKKMTENLKNAGFFVEWEDVMRQAGGGVVARPHIARAILAGQENKEKLEGAKNEHDFIEKFLTDESPHFVKRAHISAKDAIVMIHRAGGVAAWSHPAIHFKPRIARGAGADMPTDYEAVEKFLHELMEWEIDGVEVCNPSPTEDDTEFVEGLAVRYRLLRTAGSDFHEKQISARSPEGLHAAEHVGDYETYGFSTDGMVVKLDEAMARRTRMHN